MQHILNVFCDILMPPLVRWAITGISKIANALFRRTRQASTEARRNSQQASVELAVVVVVLRTWFRKPQKSQGNAMIAYGADGH